MMMLDSLKSYDPQEAGNILAALALASVPNPSSEEPALVKQYSSYLPKVENEIRSRLKIAFDDNSSTSRSRFDGELAKILAATFLDRKNRNEILARAGQSGKLAPAEYLIDFGALPTVFYGLGTRNGHLLDAIAHADDVQHLQVEGTVDEKPFSIFVRFVPQRRSEDTFWLVVFAHRYGVTQTVHHAWRVYPTDIDISGCKVPLDVLKTFVQRFGLDIEIGKFKGKFVADTEIPVEMVETNGENLVKFQTPLIRDAEKKIFVSTMSAVPFDNPPRVYVSVAYAIDLRKYVPYLLSHNVEVSQQLRAAIVGSMRR
jgi:hypothetical protein